MGFFAWEASWGKVLTLDQLKRKGIPLVNRCCLCEEYEETIDHLLIHCSRAKMLWDLLLAVTGFNWVFPRTVCQLLLTWQGASVGKKRKRVWMAVRAPPPGPLRRGVVPLTGYPPSSQGFLSPPWARTWDHELRYPPWARGFFPPSPVGSGNYLEWVSKLMVPGSSPRRRKKPL